MRESAGTKQRRGGQSSTRAHTLLRSCLLSNRGHTLLSRPEHSAAWLLLNAVECRKRKRAEEGWRAFCCCVCGRRREPVTTIRLRHMAAKSIVAEAPPYSALNSRRREEAKKGGGDGDGGADE